ERLPAPADQGYGIARLHQRERGRAPDPCARTRDDRNLGHSAAPCWRFRPTLSRAAPLTPYQRGRSEQPRLIADEHAFEREHALLGLGAARRREAAKLAARGEYAMAGDDQRHGIARHRDADVLCGLRSVHSGAPGKLAVGDGFAEGDLTQHLVDRAAERIDALEVEFYGLEVDTLPGKI